MLSIFSAFGLSASAGLNAYLPMLIVSVAAKLGVFQLSEPFDVMTNWWVIGALSVLTLIEMFVDKIPAVDTLNDVIGTVIRPAAGAILFAASAGNITEISPVLSLVLGLFVAGGVHLTKTAARPIVTATTAGIGNPIVSTIEDVLALVMTLLAILLPVVVLIFMVIVAVLFTRWWFKRANRQAAVSA